MLDITDAAEAALAYVTVNRDSLPYTTDDLMLVQAFLELRDADMVKGETDWGHQMFRTACTISKPALMSLITLASS